MPKSKRAKVVPLSKTKQDRKALKGGLIEKVQENVDKFQYAYVFSFENMRTSHFKDLRGEWADSKFVLGKNKIIQIALTPEGEAYREGLDALAGDVSGNVGLLFTDRKPEDVKQFFASYGVPDYARAGYVPSQTITIPAGKLAEWPHTMMDSLRKLMVPVRLDKGTIVVTEEMTICTEGNAITPEQGRLLKMFGHELAVFKIDLVSVWRSKDGSYERLSEGGFGRYAGPGSAEAGGKAPQKPKSRTKSTMKAGKGALKVRNAGADEDEEEEEEEEDDDEEDGAEMEEDDE